MAPLDGRWAPSRYHKELQRAIAFRSFISILRSGVRKKQTQESILERLYHKGETNEHGELVQEALVDQAIKGVGQFVGLCDRHSYISIDGGTGERNEEVRLVVQDCFTRTLSVRFVFGESFTRESLSLAKLSDNKKLVSGRTLRAGAEIAHRNGKKAYEYAMDFLDENLELPPNKTIEDYDNYILTMMYKDQKQMQTAAAKPPNMSPEPEQHDIGVRPADWIFDGWFAFRLYGPIVDESMLEYKTDAFADPPEINDDDEEDDGKVKLENGNSLAAPSAGINATPTRKRWNKLPPGPFPPHLSEEDKRHAMDLVLQRVATRERLAQAEIESLLKKTESLSRSMEMELKIALTTSPLHHHNNTNNTNHHHHQQESWGEYRKLQRELAVLWELIEMKHKETKHRDAYECEVVNEYLSLVTTKKFRFDPKPA